MKKFYARILNAVRPIVQFTGRIHMPFSRKKVTGEDYYRFRDFILPGAVLLSTTYGELSNLINPEKIKHGGMYVGNVFGNNIMYVIEATGSGVKFTDLVTFMTTKDRIVCCDPEFITDSDRGRIPQIARELIGTPYDWGFTDGDNSLYCFETIAKIYDTLGKDIDWTMKEIANGFEIYSYTTFYNSPDFTTLFDTCEA